MPSPNTRPRSARTSPARRKDTGVPRKPKAAAVHVGTAKGLSRALSHDAILDGVSASLIKSAVDHHVLTLDEVYRFVPKSTFARRLRDDTTLSIEESDRIARFVRLKSYVGDVFESREDAETWLGEMNPALGGDAPIDLVLTDEGARRVETVLRRIDYGDYS